MNPVRSRLSRKLALAASVAGLALASLGATTTAAAITYSTSMPLILHNVPPEDLLANTRGVCNGSFNIVIRNVSGAAGALRYLDAAQKCGLKAVLFFSTTTSGGTVYPSRVGPLVRAVKNHPALYGYLSVKEPSWSGISLSEMRSLYNAFRAADPNHPVVALLGDIPHFGTSQNPWGTGVANVLWVDWYPVTYSRGYITTASTHFPKVRSYVASVTPGTPIWLMVQGHGYRPGDRRPPTSAELVRQVNDGTTYLGAAGIAFYIWDHAAYDSDFSRNPKLWATARSLMTFNFGTVVVPSR